MRETWDCIFMEICKIICKRSTCARIQTASILVRDKNIISIGYNGVCSGQEHCFDYWKNIWINNYSEKYPVFENFTSSEEFKLLHHQYSSINELHAEVNTILQCETSAKGSILYTIYSPCINCAKAILSAKISKVIYLKKYDRDVSGITLLNNNNICIEQYK